MSLPDDASSTGASSSDQWTMPNPLPRSKRGCTTCRRRKVKCDEARPRCGHCTRLERHCDWERSYRFHELSEQIHEKYHTTGLSAPNAPVTSSRKWQEMIANRQSSQERRTSPALSDKSSEENIQEQQALTRAPGVYYLVHTPGSLAKQLEHEEKLQAHISRQRYRQKMHFATDLDPDAIMVEPSMLGQEDESACYDAQNIPQWMSMSMSMSPPSLSPPDTSMYLDDTFQNGNESRLFMAYETEVFQRIMPFSAKYRLNLDKDQRDIVVASAKDFPPLQHAIHATTLMSLGAHGQPHLITAAFSHYSRAISACSRYLSTDISSSRFFFTHYLLLLFDTCCMSQGWPHDATVASQHYKRLYEIARNQPKGTWSPLQISISWKLLLCDAQTCLTGAKEAGAYVRAFQANRSAFPSGSTREIEAAACADNDSARVCKLVYLLYQFIAELSQWAVEIRAAYYEARVTGEDIEPQIHNLLLQGENMMDDACPRDPYKPTRIRTTPGTMSHTMFECLQLEYAATRLYLLTSVYPGQRFSLAHDHAEVAKLCTFILSWTSDAVMNSKTENYRLHALFLAGCMTKVEDQKSIAIGLLRAMENSPVSFNASNSRRVLERIHSEQLHAELAGGIQEQVDWLDYTRQGGEDTFTYFSL